MSWVEHGDPLAEPDFPPLLNGRRIIEGQSPLAAAVAGATARDLGAGDILWDDNPDRVQLAIVLEPEVDLRRAAHMLPLAMVAVGDCIGALAPPQVGVTFRWPNTVLVNDAAVGRADAVASATTVDQVPDWMVVALDLRLRHGADRAEPGYAPDRTALAEEGCETLTNIQLIESYSRHFLTWLNIWQDEGFRAVHQSWIVRVEGRSEPVDIPDFDETDVTVTGLDEDGNLLVRDEIGTVRSLSLLDAIAAPAVET